MTDKPRKVRQGEKLRGAQKVARIPVKVIPTVEMPRKPDWIRIKVPNSPQVQRIKRILPVAALLITAAYGLPFTCWGFWGAG